jgi:hypothetical protein
MLKETIYIFDCGCEVPNSQVIRSKKVKKGRNVFCPDHIETGKAIARRSFCETCGIDIMNGTTGKVKKYCLECGKKAKSRQVKEWKAKTNYVPPVKIEGIDRRFRAKDEPKRVNEDMSRINCTHWESCLYDVVLAQRLPNRPCAICERYDKGEIRTVTFGEGYDARYFPADSGRFRIGA